MDARTVNNLPPAAALKLRRPFCRCKAPTFRKFAEGCPSLSSTDID
jgi:hypothetical protein